jgi:orotidine-5'-phosphate decarboxylase
LPKSIVALDVPTTGDAVRLVERLGGECSFYKVGSELFASAGPAIVDYLHARGASVFLDLKLHDIPNTVERAARVAARAGVRLMTVHAVGGKDMVRAGVRGAAEGAAEAGTVCGVLAVTVLTALDERRLGEGWGRSIRTVRAEVLRLAALARRAGAAGLVCAGSELVALRREHRNRLELLVPGVRPARAARGDQIRVVTPAEAATSGADYVVLGRAVTQAVDPVAALRAVVEQLEGGAVAGS